MSALDPKEELAQRLGLASVPPCALTARRGPKAPRREDYLSDESIASVV